MIQQLKFVRAGLALYVPERLRKHFPSLSEERGQAFVEYALLLLLIAVAVTLTAAFTGLGGKISDALSSVGNVLHDNTPGGTTTTP